MLPGDLLAFPKNLLINYILSKSYQNLLIIFALKQNFILMESFIIYFSLKRLYDYGRGGVITKRQL